MAEPTVTISAVNARHVKHWPSILALLAVHIVAVVILAIISEDDPNPVTCLFVALLFCQTSLVGMWVGLANARWPWRLSGLVAGVGLLTVILAEGIDEWESEILILVALPTLLLATVTGVVRLTKGRLLRVDADTPPLKERLRFSIRHLMILTFVVACLLTLVPLLGPTFRGLDDVFELSVLGICYAAVGMTAVRAMMGSGNPVTRSFFTLLIGVGAGVTWAYGVRGDDHLFWIATTVLQAVFLTASLAVIRSAGYRLASRGAAM